MNKMKNWNKEWIIENAEQIFNQSFIDTIYKSFNSCGINESDTWNLTLKVSENIYKAIKDGKYKGSSKKEFWGYVHTTIKNVKNDYWKEYNLLPKPVDEILPDIEEQILFSNIYKMPVDQIVINKIAFENAIKKLYEELTDLQWEVLKYTAQGLNSPEIAKKLGKKPQAVRKLRERGRETAKKLFNGDPFENFEF